MGAAGGIFGGMIKSFGWGMATAGRNDAKDNLRKMLKEETEFLDRSFSRAVKKRWGDASGTHGAQAAGFAAGGVDLSSGSVAAAKSSASGAAYDDIDQLDFNREIAIRRLKRKVREGISTLDNATITDAISTIGSIADGFGGGMGGGKGGK